MMEGYAMAMLLAAALERNAEIQADLAAGRLTVPYPEAIKKELALMGEVFAQHCTTPETARELVRLINEAKPATPRKPAELPW
jgi:hypothetical protein